ncbi:oligosaccharide flippase family protein [Sphingomonas sp. URHD0057]|uniref:oligosaccharide flippase family protein n=1 Tax=Sphingomonas sp. URHD0057 TaxID=1380389 RepID=UPI0018CC1F51|nr:polysaccharide biosynthesis C-terminal domain-containing protein [Sphingomonas sp. URHD0057]
MTRFLLKGSFVSIALRIGGVALGYLAHVLLSRLLGLQNYGEYVVALGWALVLALPARVGFDNSALRFSTIYLEDGRFGSLRGYVQVAAVAVGLSSILAGILMVLLASRFGKGIPFATLVWGAVTILPLALLGVGSALLRTTRRIFAAQFYDQLLRPGLLILLVGGTAVAGLALHAATALMFTALAAALALGALLVHLLRVLAPQLRTAADYSHWREWFSLSIPLLIMGAMQELLNQLEIILLGTLAGPREAGLFSAAWRLASLAPFALVSLSVVSGPLVASAYHRRDRAELHRITSLSARIGLAFAVVASGLLLVVGRPLLALFGPEFPQAYPALAILLGGAIVNAFTGIVGYLLTLTGRQNQGLLIFAAGLIVSIALNLLLIPPFGIVGAAIASATALSCWNLAMLIYVRRVIGIDTSAIGLRPTGPDKG